MEDFEDDEVMQDPLDTPLAARKSLKEKLHDRGDLDEFDKDGVSRQTGFEGSVGNSTFNSNNTERRYFNHEKRSLENIML